MDGEIWNSHRRIIYRFNNDVGFNPDAGVQTDEAINGLRIAYTLIPITGTLLAIYVMKDYEIDEEEANRIRELLKAQQS